MDSSSDIKPDAPETSNTTAASGAKAASLTTLASILFHQEHDRQQAEVTHQPGYFGDLNLDQVVGAITGPKSDYNLAPFFHLCLSDPEAIRFRQDVMRDLEDRPLYRHVEAFAASMRTMRQFLERVDKGYHSLQKQRWWLSAVLTYCDAVRLLAWKLADAAPQSKGFAGFRTSLAAYAASPSFQGVVTEAEELRNKLAAIRYEVIVRGGSVAVRRYDGEIDYGALVEQTFDKFRQGVEGSHVEKPPEWSNLNHVEEKVLEFVARLNPEVFGALDVFCRSHADYVDPLLKTFDREVQFYVAYLDYIGRFEKVGLDFAFPEVTRADKSVHVRDGFDLALALKMVSEGKDVVRNDVELGGPERILVVSGPNQGGKTTLARMFGQLHHLACLGCPVPGSEARLFLFDQMFTHFEREESIDTPRGKLQDDLVRIHDYLARATCDSILIMNEIFTSTTLQDATVLSERIMQSVIERDLLSVWVTFIDELASFGPQTVSMVSTVVPDNPAERTFKVVRRPADGLAYALSIAEKYNLTYDRLGERLA